MTRLHRLIEWIGRKCSLFILTPCVHAIGNCSEEIQFGLIKARQEKRRLVLLAPFDLFWKLRYQLPNIEILDVASPHRLELKPLPLLLIRSALTVVYGSLWTFSKALHKLAGRPLPGRYTHPAIGGSILWKPEESPAAFLQETVDAYGWTTAIQTPLEVGLKTEKRARAHALRIEMGIPEDAWFAGLHVREGGFKNDHEEGACRNATIGNFLPAIREITSRGGWVVRLGDKTMTPLPPMERVVDYPHTPFKSALMDLYLLSECRFYVGMSSGILDTAWLFQRPMIITNMTNMTLVYPRRPEDRGILKHVYSKSRRRRLSLEELLEGGWEVQHYFTLADDIIMQENSPAEILAVVKEFLDDDGRVSALQEEFNRRRIAAGRRLLGAPFLKDHYDDMHNRYRYASRLEAALGSIGRDYLEANWLVSSGPEKASLEPSQNRPL